MGSNRGCFQRRDAWAIYTAFMSRRPPGRRHHHRGAQAAIEREAPPSKPIAGCHLHLGVVSRPVNKAYTANLSRIGDAASEESQWKREYKFQQGSHRQV